MWHVCSISIANDLTNHRQMMRSVSSTHFNQVFGMFFVTSLGPSNFQAILVTKSCHFTLRTLSDVVVCCFPTAKTFCNVRNRWIRRKTYQRYRKTYLTLDHQTQCFFLEHCCYDLRLKSFGGFTYSYGTVASQ